MEKPSASSTLARILRFALAGALVTFPFALGAAFVLARSSILYQVPGCGELAFLGCITKILYGGTAAGGIIGGVLSILFRHHRRP